MKLTAEAYRRQYDWAARIIEDTRTLLENLETVAIASPDQVAALARLQKDAAAYLERLDRATITVPDAEPPTPNEPPAQQHQGLAGMYAMHDVGCEYPNGTTLAYWREVEDSYADLDRQVGGHERVMLEVYHHTSLHEGRELFTVWQPPDAPEPYRVTRGDYVARIPRYDDLTYLARYVAFIERLGQRYDGRVQAVVASLGLDGETQFAKPVGGVDWENALWGTAAEGVPGAFRGRWIPVMLKAFAEAFPTTPVLVNCAPGDRHTKRAVLSAALKWGIGWKNSGLIPDAPNRYGYDADGNPPTRENWQSHTGFYGSWDLPRMFPELPLVTESHMGYATEAEMWGMVYAGLSYHPTAMVWHKTLLDAPGLQAFDWAEQYIGVTKATTPGVWWRRHDSPYPKTRAGNTGYYSGHLTDWEFWLHRTEGAGLNLRVADGVDLGDSPTLRWLDAGGEHIQSMRPGSGVLLPDTATFAEIRR